MTPMDDLWKAEDRLERQEQARKRYRAWINQQRKARVERRRKYREYIEKRRREHGNRA